MTTALISQQPGYQRMVWRKRGYGTWKPFIDAEPVRQHILELQASGLGRRRIAELAGLHHSTVSAIIYGRDGRPPNPRIRPATAAKLLAIQHGAGHYIIPGAGTIRRVQALMAIGWPQTHIAARIGVTSGRISELLRRTKVTAATAQLYAELYAELHNQNPADHGIKRNSITLVSNYAVSQGWRGPDYWEDVDRIDDPNFDPDARDDLAASRVEDAEWLMAGGLDYEQAARRLGISTKTLDRAYEAVRQQQAVAS